MIIINPKGYELTITNLSIFRDHGSGYATMRPVHMDPATCRQVTLLEASPRPR